MQGNHLVIGLDYGTTYTGVSHSETSSNDISRQHVDIVHDWPACHTKIATKEKVPSEIAYEKDGLKWGSNIPPHVPRQMWTKLALDEQHEGEVDKISQELSQKEKFVDKKPVDIVADYLAQVKGHLFKNLDDKYGEQLWRTLPITLVVTMPAVWSDAAKARTLQAYDKAGFNANEIPHLQRIISATEPEAAAIHTIRTMRGTAQDSQLKVGDGFIVCDMGGGTVDLISYRIASLNPTIIEEATIGGGDQCGGTFVDRAFMEFLERRLGGEDFSRLAGCRSEDIPRITQSEGLGRLTQLFNSDVKAGFDGTEQDYTRVLPLPKPLHRIEDDENRGSLDGELTITGADVASMFEFPIRRTYELLLEQLERARSNDKVKIKYIFMVGGFSESPYIHRKIKEFARNTGLQAFKPAHAWSAVARGAAAIGLEQAGEAVVSSRLCRRYYGTRCSVLFRGDVHLNVDSFRDEMDGLKYARDQAEWLVKKGQELPVAEETHASVCIIHTFWHDEEPESMQMKLFACDLDKAPHRIPDNPTSGHVYLVATVTADLRNVPKTHWETGRSPNNKIYYSIETLVHISMQSTLEFYITVDGKKYGTVKAEYE